LKTYLTERINGHKLMQRHKWKGSRHIADQPEQLPFKSKI
jgi:hypothetical protein